MIIKEHEYRIKKMNAIQILALRTQINFDDIEKSEQTYDTILSCIEVKLDNNTWLQVYDGKNFYPVDIENDIDTIQELIKYGLDYIKSVFQKSVESH